MSIYKLRNTTFLVLWLFLVSLPLLGQSAYTLEPSETTRILAQEQREPDARALLSAALHFSGASTTRQEAAMVLGLRAIAQAQELESTVLDPYERGARVLDLVHGIIKRYDLLESRLDNALLDGRFNCVGASTLYTILGSAAGLIVRGVLLPDHAYCYVVFDGQRIDVETTSIAGYDRSDDELHSGPSSDVSARGIMALALRNRASLLERSGRWPEAMMLSVDAFAYAPDEGTLDALLGRIHNAVVALIRDRKYVEALALAEAAIERYGPIPIIASTRDAAMLASLTEALRAATPQDALAIADKAAESGVADAGWLEKAYTFAYAGMAEEYRKAGDHLGAWSILTEASSRFFKAEALASLERVARTNWLRSEHNLFVEMYNAGRYAEALASILQAMEIAPDERLLLDDAESAKAALSDTKPRASP